MLPPYDSLLICKQFFSSSRALQITVEMTVLFTVTYAKYTIYGIQQN